jgi:hypothetical protein
LVGDVVLVVLRCRLIKRAVLIIVTAQGCVLGFASVLAQLRENVILTTLKNLFHVHILNVWFLIVDPLKNLILSLVYSLSSFLLERFYCILTAVEVRFRPYNVPFFLPISEHVIIVCEGGLMIKVRLAYVASICRQIQGVLKLKLIFLIFIIKAVVVNLGL